MIPGAAWSWGYPGPRRLLAETSSSPSTQLGSSRHQPQNHPPATSSAWGRLPRYVRTAREEGGLAEMGEKAKQQNSPACARTESSSP